MAHERIYRAVREVLSAGVIPIICGGDHSISIAASKALSDHIGLDKKMGYLHFGAQLDMADNWAGEKITSPCTLARVTELANLPAENVAHIGARNSLNPKDHIDLANERGIRFYPMFETLERGIESVVGEAIDHVWNDTFAQYISINMNIMDASAAPGVTAPEPAGLESREIMRVASLLGERGTPSVIEISELCPVFDVSETTSKLAACVVLRIMAANCKKRGELIDQGIKRPANL